MVKKLKVIMSIILIILMLVGGGYSIYYFSKPSENKKIVTTIFPIYDIARNIMGSENDLLLLEDNGVDVHSYSPSAKDIVSIHKSELFIYIGGESDQWVGEVLRTSENANLQTLCLIDEVEKIEESDDGIFNGDESHSDENEDHENTDLDEVEYDEHIWLSLKNAKVMTEKIREYLTLVFPERQELFKINANKYLEKLDELDKEYNDTFKGKDYKIIVADRFPFVYLTKDYGIKYFACFSGCSTETQASADMMSALIENINSSDSNTIYVLESSDKNIANSAINDSRCKNGIDIEILNSCQSINIKNIDSMSYLGIMQTNLNALKKGMGYGNI